MTPEPSPSVALLDHPAARALAAALWAEGARVSVIGAPRVAPLDELLARRGFTGPLSHLPLLTVRLLRAGCSVVHAFTPADAAAALAWKRRTGGPVVFTCGEPLHRRALADRRLRMRLLSAATEGADAVVVPDEAVRASVRRWLALDAAVLAPADAAGHLRLYERLRRHR